MAVEINANNICAWSGLGFAFHRLGKNEEATEWYDKDIAIKKGGTLTKNNNNINNA